MALNLKKTDIVRKLLLFAAICGGLGAADFFKPVSLLLYTWQSKVHIKKVSGDVVVVGIDSPSINEVGRWPWPRDKQAELLRRIDGYGPKAVYIDIGYQGKTSPSADASLRNTLKTMIAPTKVVALAAIRDDRSIRTVFSDPAVIGSTESVTAYTPYLFSYVWELPTRVSTERGMLPSVAASIANIDGAQTEAFRLDYSYDPNSIPIVPAKDVLAQTIGLQKLNGKTVILGVTDVTQNDIHSMPGWAERAGVLFHVVGAETLKNGLPAKWGWVGFFVFAAAICIFHLTLFGLKYSRYIIWAGICGVLSASTWLTTLHIVNDPFAALALLGCTAVFVSRQKAALIRTNRHSETGFSNMTGYMVEEVISNSWFIGASLHRTETRLGYTLPEDQMKIMREAGRRLSMVIDEKQLTHNEKQQFLWEMPSTSTSQLAEHLSGLRRMFAEPLEIDGRKIDIDINFGVDRHINENVKTRMESALEASIDAIQSNSTFKIATAADFGAHLRSQFAAEFKTAVVNGDIDLRLEPQKDLATDAINSAAASLRWIHPAHGQITTAELFAFARDAGNLRLVTDYLCEKAMVGAARLTQLNPSFVVSVKISMDVVLTPDFCTRASALADRFDCEAGNIIFEVIDTHKHKDNPLAHKAFRDLKDQGFSVGIGDFGISDADIALLKAFKPHEIFFVKSFSAELLGSTSNRMFAMGAMRIAHANGVKTTAEGLDDRDVLTALNQNGCNRGKGKIISMPLSIDDFVVRHLQFVARRAG